MNGINQRYDAIVVGGGMVGAAVALGLARNGFQVAVLEQAAPAAFMDDSAPDIRVSALGYASVSLLKSLGAWSGVEQMRCAPYRRLETWEWDDARVAFSADDLHLPELGFMVENRVLQLVLWQCLAEQQRCDIRCRAQIRSMVRTPACWQIALDSGETLSAPLVLGADGANSRVRQWAGIGINGWQYRQSCLLIAVDTQQPQQDCTWQQFTPQGPRAFLPLFGSWGALAWYDSPRRIRQLQSLSLPQLDNAIAETFPTRLGPVKSVAAGAFPLVRRHAQRYVAEGVALVGDAAHTINPLAGQGVNLGYRDADALIDVVTGARDAGECWYSEAVLLRYQRRRKADNLLMQNGMDLFYNAFSNRLPPLTFARNMALLAAERAGHLKTLALKYAIGV
ncbi:MULTISPECIES: 3-demethoxyubiquinol 3-hydroxylase [Symbiopectobacterium]|uniref:3-demethoxyubiquinol 3-hydroxylase n=1 Tax=Symbiopectobacterium TaxID=801 RepID=UPI001A25AC1A|nr:MULTISPECIES: 3-demethoxyubiquinol 3-hydroxylase [Symbiopectobacterium]MBG6247496.1 2-octaprenyl-3-methyl-6-methoxy-1,4-benzoquinol hydroxylase [Candidatus Symbiopectobacterium sp. PLON1]MBT9429667.1 2-octaprenyl-3-methyl-6-methoxy-1,4-benzoquinol hydroxylase [Candidatus Symbiopectobacterium endolongispinus]